MDWMPPAISRERRRVVLDTLGPDAFEREFGTQLRSEVWQLWTGDLHKRFPQKSEPWLNFRNTRVTASIVGTILGYPTFAGESRRKKFLEFIGLGKPFVQNPACDWGNKYEDCGMAALERVLARESHKTIFLPFDIIDSRRPLEEPFAYSPDGIGTDGTVAECKCPWRRAIIPGYVKPAYGDGQVQFGMYNLDGHSGLYDQTYFFEYRPPPNSAMSDLEILSITKISSDPQWAPRHVWLLKEFWQEVVDFRATQQMPDHYISEARFNAWYTTRVAAEPHRFPPVQRVMAAKRRLVDTDLEQDTPSDSNHSPLPMAGDDIDWGAATTTTTTATAWHFTPPDSHVSSSRQSHQPGSDIVW